MQARERSRKYDWMGAADLQRRAIEQLGDGINPLEEGRVIELLARSYFKGAFQSKTHEEFKERMRLAESSYDQASSRYEALGLRGLFERSKARGLFATYWLESGSQGQGETVRRCIELSDDAAMIFESRRDDRELAQTHEDTLNYLKEAFWFVSEWKQLNEILERGVDLGEKAVRSFENLGDDEDLLESLSLTVWFTTDVAFYAAQHERFRELEEMSRKLATRMRGLSHRIGEPYTVCLANEAAGLVEHFYGSTGKALELFEAAASMAETVMDSYLTAQLLILATINAFYEGFGTEDAEGRREMYGKGEALAKDALEHFMISLQADWIGQAYSWQADIHTYLALHVETDVERKKQELQRAIEIARKGVMVREVATETMSVGHTLAKALYFLSTLETDADEKERLLKEALPVREKTVRVAELVTPYSWEAGIVRNYQALIRAEQAKMEQDPSKKLELLENAASDMQRCIDVCSERARTGEMAPLAQYSEWYGDILVQLYRLSAKPEISSRAIMAYENSILYQTKAGHVSPIASLRWKIAGVHDAVGDYGGAAEVFRRASEDYRLGGTKVPALSTTFNELASYMDGWAMIEDARVHHEREQYSQASEDYEKASGLLQRTKEWSLLSKHYGACSLLEQGEASSRLEKPEPSIEAFSRAATSFQEAAADLENKVKETLAPKQRQELEEWIRISKVRERYCSGRVELEEARLLDKKGDEEASSRKYLSASQKFGALLPAAPSSQSRDEMETLMLFCEAWAKMKEAESESSPELYGIAGESFMKAQRATARKRFRILAQANASICRALEAGTRFRLTQNTQLYSEIKKHMQTAVDYYQEAGFENAADWTRATQRLFDALTYLSNAEAEIESKKKTELYHLAEKYLDLAAKLYGEAGFSKRKDEVLKHLRRVREDKQILLSPVEVLSENPAVSEAPGTPVSLVRDQAMGLERFEVASVVGNLNVSQKELGVGSSVTVELEIANVGKTAATLIKLESVAPHGFELDRENMTHRVEDNYIDMRGRRLEYLKTHEVKVALTAVRKGEFELRPRILFADEKGNYRSYEFEPTALTVKELGISGWLKGPK